MKKFFLIGNPVGHSCSPVIHNYFYDSLNLDARYELLCLQRSMLGNFVEEFKKNSDMQGFNVTLPFKTDIIDFLDDISDEAAFIGAVNTVAKVDGRVCGFNTDGMGFYFQLKKHGVDITGKNIKILGAGGSARAISYTLNKYRAGSISIYNRTLANAQRISEKIHGNVFAKLLSDFDTKDCDLLIQTSSVGLKGKNEESIIDSLNGIKYGTPVFDIIYNPLKTKFMYLAEQSGCLVSNGCEMLIYQAMLSEKIWLDIDLVDDTSMVDRLCGMISKDISQHLV